MAAGYAEAIVPRSQRDDLNFVRRINQALLSAWKKRVLPEPMLDANHLVGTAVRKERQDIEGGHWEEALKCLTNDLQHHRTATFRQAALCAEATASVVNLVAIISGRRDKHE